MKLRLLTFTIFIISFCGLAYKVSARGGTCEFSIKEINIDWTNNFTDYTCSLKQLVFNGPNVATEIKGTHQVGKDNDDVKTVDCSKTDRAVKNFDVNFCRSFKFLKMIKLVELQIEHIDPTSFEFCTKLKFLNLKNNKIREISAGLFKPLVNLIELHLSINKIQTLHPNSFENLRSLEHLGLYENEISDLPAGLFKPLWKLIGVSVAENKIRRLEADTFVDLVNLEGLRLSENFLTDLPPNIFAPLINLKELFLDRNQLSTIHSDSFGVHSKLWRIELWNNSMNSFDERIIDKTAVSEIVMWNNKCNEMKYEYRIFLKENLKSCIDNYRPRPLSVRATSPATRKSVPITKSSKVGIDTPTCGQSKSSQGNIIGGGFIKKGDFPWIAALIKDHKFFCSGILISDRKVVSAAHCIQTKHSSVRLQPSDIIVDVGIHDLNNHYEIGKKSMAVRHIHVNPNWNPHIKSYDGDLAVLVLEEKLRFNNYIQPICLIEPGSNVASIMTGVVVGYGKSEDETKEHENIPKIINVPIHDSLDCFFKFPDLLDLSSRNTLCGGYANGTGVCEGDSGSGLFIQYYGTYYFRGIVSSSLRDHNLKCDVNSYSVYIDVIKYKDWIEKIDTLGNFFE